MLEKDIFTCKILQTMARQTPDGYRININSTVEPECRGPALKIKIKKRELN